MPSGSGSSLTGHAPAAAAAPPSGRNRWPMTPWQSPPGRRPGVAVGQGDLPARWRGVQRRGFPVVQGDAGVLQQLLAQPFGLYPSRLWVKRPCAAAVGTPASASGASLAATSVCGSGWWAMKRCWRLASFSLKASCTTPQGCQSGGCCGRAAASWPSQRWL